MRTVNIDGKEIGLKGSPLSVYYYHQEFGRNLISDMLSISKAADDLEKLDFVIILRMIWVMNKTYIGAGKPFLNFEKWLEGFESIDFTDQGFMIEVIEEAQNGFFRGNKSGTEPESEPECEPSE